MSTFNSTTTTPNFDNLLLDSLLNRLQLRPPPPPPSSQPPSSQLPLSSSFEDFLADLSSFSSSSDHSNSDNDSSYDYYNDSEDEETGIHGDERARKTKLAKEESKLEKEIVKVIMGGKVETLKPNSGQAVSIGDHHVCVGFHEEDGGSGYRVWEWHGHVMLFDDLLGYTPEYVYGNYFERVASVVGKKEKKVEKKAEEKNGGLGLRELIQNGGNVGLGFGLGLGECRVLHRSHNAGLSRVIKVSREE